LYNEPTTKCQQKQKSKLDGPDKVVVIALHQAQVSRLFSSLIVQKSSFDAANKVIKIASEPLSKPLALYNNCN